MHLHRKHLMREIIMIKIKKVQYCHFTVFIKSYSQPIVHCSIMTTNTPCQIRSFSGRNSSYITDQNLTECDSQCALMSKMDQTIDMIFLVMKIDSSFWYLTYTTRRMIKQNKLTKTISTKLRRTVVRK